MRPIIIWPWRGIAARDPHSGDARVGKDDAEEGKASIAWRGWDDAAEEQLPVGAEALDQRAGFPVSGFLSRPAPIRQVNVREDRAEPAGRRRCCSIAGTGHEELRLRDVAIDWAEEPQGAERLEDGVVGRVVESRRQAGEWGLTKPRPRCGEEGAAGEQESVEWRARDGWSLWSLHRPS